MSIICPQFDINRITPNQHHLRPGLRKELCQVHGTACSVIRHYTKTSTPGILKPSQRPYSWQLWPPSLPLRQYFRYSFIETNATSTTPRLPPCLTLSCAFVTSRLVQRVREVEYSPSTYERFLVVVPDIHVDNVDWPVERASSIQ